MDRQPVTVSSLTGRHLGGLGLGLFGAEEAPALALHIFAVQLTNPFRELVAFEALNAGVVEPASLHIFHKALQVFGVVIAIRAIPSTHYQEAAICLSVVHPAETLRGIAHGVTRLNSTTQTQGLAFHDSAPLIPTHNSRQASKGSVQLPGPGSDLNGWKA